MPELISITLLCNFTGITIRHGCSPGNLLHIFGTSFPKTKLSNTYKVSCIFIFESFLSERNLQTCQVE